MSSSSAYFCLTLSVSESELGVSPPLARSQLLLLFCKARAALTGEALVSPCVVSLQLLSLRLLVCLFRLRLRRGLHVDRLLLPKWPLLLRSWSAFFFVVFLCSLDSEELSLSDDVLMIDLDLERALPCELLLRLRACLLSFSFIRSGTPCNPFPLLWSLG